ncbi:hypothetical protein DVH24_008086 [Malus domestica]|uniref:Urease alpha-subunit N-terminal domain-containing protein n=1 Tax=Malus domestica TaxID=3750 RepID=A0A498JKK7_MALDO|nr:hypothetical protein DVH24_008086 [Malus domestica]
MPELLQLRPTVKQDPRLRYSEGVTGSDPTLTTVISREAYANMYGPTTWDKIRLGDTILFAEIEKEFTAYGMNRYLEMVKLLEKARDLCVWGGEKGDKEEGEGGAARDLCVCVCGRREKGEETEVYVLRL